MGMFSKPDSPKAQPLSPAMIKAFDPLVNATNITKSKKGYASLLAQDGTTPNLSFSTLLGS